MSRNVRRRELTLPEDKDGLDLLHDLIGQITRGSEGQISLNVHRNADRAIRIFPQARFIHLLRDPRDVALSAIGMGWTAHSITGSTGGSSQRKPGTASPTGLIPARPIP